MVGITVKNPNKLDWKMIRHYVKYGNFHIIPK